MVQTVQKSIEIPQSQYCDDVIDVPVVSVVQVPRVWVVKKTVEELRDPDDSGLGRAGFTGAGRGERSRDSAVAVR